ncbi:NUDIX hydrolase [Phycicoccus duodecadis]|uniref:8-oxo-dGTP pyrophosphatase MutT (NUDIX family) n=1 Tax=Phycicoccus duodecadis TaxID=173053 RepID=A0A2N3YGX4_9MICO|nr:NUDIX domain-containing protein [Phycicoccus duodecadis]PKW26107.1 8-oxo-dGTP pyrophosphatase MutT (NUDIX family) [Phycicoccus duodecadis]
MTAPADVARTFAHLYADAGDLLGGWAAPDAAQEELRRQYLGFLAAHPDGVAKAGPSEHLTASCLVLDPAGTRVLLTHHRKARQWFQFGGHLEAGDASVWAAARREAREESGLASLEPLPDPVQLDRHVLDGDFRRCREHLDVRYVAVAPEGAEPAVSGESLDVRWWPVDALPEGTRAELSPLVRLARRVAGLG